ILYKMDNRYSKRREDKFKLLRNSDMFYCYVAQDEEGIKGFIIMENLGEGVSHYMVQINVAEKRRGIGRKLVERVFEKIGLGGHISLCVNMDNKDAIEFYKALGFRISGFTRNYRRGQDKWWYEIDL
ncbi:MAG: GNAT family N-acetyltransferase, partial [Nanoarchaeota archaeon]